MSIFSKISILTTLLLGILFTNPKTVHADSCPFYRYVFTEWGYRIQKDSLSGCIKTNEFYEVSVENNISFRIYTDLEEYKEISYPKLFLNLRYPSSQDQPYIYIISDDKSIQFIILEDYLIDYKFSNQLKTYISAYIESVSSKGRIENSIEQNKFITENIILIEMFKYASVIILLVALIYQVLRISLNYPPRFQEIKSAIYSRFHDVYITFNKIKPFMLLLAFLSLISLIRIAILISYKDQKSVNPDYVISLISQLNNNSFILSSIENRTETNLVLAINFQILLLLVVIIIIPYLINFLRETAHLFKVKSLKPDFPMYLFIIMNIIGIPISLMIIENSFTYYLLVVTIFIGLVLFPKNDISFKSHFKKSRFILVVISILIFEIIIAFNYLNKKTITEVLSLFDYDSKVVYPSVIYTLDDNTHYSFIQKSEINKKTPVFVNNFLIFHPNYKKIVNTSIDNINTSIDNFIIPNVERSDKIVDKILLDNRYLDLYSSKVPTSSFILNTSNRNLDTIRVNIIDKCKSKSNPYVIELKSLDLDGERIGNSYTEKIINAKGCDVENLQPNIYRYNLSLQSSYKQIYILLAQHDLTIEIDDSSMKLLDTYLSNDIYSSSTFFNRNLEDDTIYNVIDQNLEDDFIVTDNNMPNQINLSVQRLYERELLGKELEFWTPNSAPIIDRL